MYYIQESDKPNIFFRIFNIIKLKQDKIIMPIKADEEINQRKAEKLAIKTKKILEITNCNKIILSKKMKKQENYKNELYNKQIQILEGKWLFGVLSYKIIDYIINKKKMKEEEVKISITVNDLTEPILENIKYIIRKYKKVNIVTNHREKFKNIEQKVMEEEGIMITVSNNKRKSLSKSNIILNIDFPTEMMDKYTIQEEAIIVNIRGNVQIHKKRFNGININKYEINFLNIEEFDYDKNHLYDKKDIYEAQIYQNQPFEYIKRKIERDKVKIEYLMGNKTKL